MDLSLQSTIGSLESQVTGANYDKKTAQMQAAQLTGELEAVRGQLAQVRTKAEAEASEREASQAEMEALEAAVSDVQTQLAEVSQTASQREKVCTSHTCLAAPLVGCDCRAGQ